DRGDIRAQYRFLPRGIRADDFDLNDDRAAMQAAIQAVYELGYADPANASREYPSCAFGRTSKAPYDKWDSLLTFPEATVGVHTLRISQRTGSLTHHQLHSSVLGDRRTVTIWEPKGISAAAALPLVVLLDGEDMLYAIDAPGIAEAASQAGTQFRLV